MKYETLINVLQDKVDTIAEDKWSEDICPPSFIVSNLFCFDEDVIGQYIMLTIIHLGSQVSSLLYPDKDCNYGQKNLYYEMEQLYNKTM